ncbi:hypothetical protein AEP_00525 [Curvibacter sp. AEP1-3]|uniref:Mor transcription activator family protein n=1 Tax=Curvibacter sp. AEP1-3 TaxID=1844971 RepID=UPI000B3CF7C7|nr:Mor transcription activator family protein [Curvibacter sp. AEP1-3]ARV17485.1 hypothetical protein AEP_00525 [Curvibacter sp. AEP1-3]
MVTPTHSKAATPAAHAGSENDIIEDMLSLVLAMAPGFTAELAKQADKQIRAKWAGDRPYIARRSGEGSSERNAQIKADYLRGERIALLERRYKVSRSRLWQIIKS